MAVSEIKIGSAIMQGPQINEGSGQRLETSFDVNQTDQVPQNLPEDLVKLSNQLGIAIKPGPTPSHNIAQITNHKTGEVTEIPPNSVSALYALAQRLAKLSI